MEAGTGPVTGINQVAGGTAWHHTLHTRVQYFVCVGQWSQLAESCSSHVLSSNPEFLYMWTHLERESLHKGVWIQPHIKHSRVCASKRNEKIWDRGKKCVKTDTKSWAKEHQSCRTQQWPLLPGLWKLFVGIPLASSSTALPHHPANTHTCQCWAWHSHPPTC